VDPSVVYVLLSSFWGSRLWGFWRRLVIYVVLVSNSPLGDWAIVQAGKAGRQLACLFVTCTRKSESIALVLSTNFFFWLMPTTCPPACIHTLHLHLHASVRTAKKKFNLRCTVCRGGYQYEFKLNYYLLWLFFVASCVRVCVRARRAARSKVRKESLSPSPSAILLQHDDKLKQNS
jgi:hypothetical protein